MSNPTKINKEKKENLIKLLLQGVSLSKACKALGVDRSCMYWARKRDPEFEGRVQEARDHIAEMVEDALYTNAMNGDTTAQIFVLCNRYPKRWRSVNRLEIKAISEEEKKAEALAIVGNLSEEELNRLEQDSKIQTDKNTSAFNLPRLLSQGS